MKKIILLGCILLSTASKLYANTDDSNIKLKGLFDFQAGFRNQKNLPYEDKNISQYNKSIGLLTNANITADVNKSINDITYGAHIILMTTTAAKTSASYNGSHIYLDSTYGKVELGSPYDVGSKMRVTFYDACAATGDDFFTYTSFAPTKSRGLEAEIFPYQFFFDSIHKVSLNQLNDKTEPSRKISYFTPEIEGFRFGISFIPDSSNSGLSGHNSSKTLIKHTLDNNQEINLDYSVRNAFSVGASYTHNIDNGIDFKVSVTGEYGNSAGKFKLYSDANHTNLLQESKLKNLKSYNIGSILNYGKMSYAVSYGNLLKSLTTKAYNKTGTDTQYYGIAVSYTQGPIKTSLSYFKSDHLKNELDAIVLGTEYKMAGFLPYAEIAVLNAKGRPSYFPNEKKKKIKNAVAIIGAKVQF